MYNIKKQGNTQVLYNDSEQCICPFAMVAIPVQTAIGQMAVHPVKTECSDRCAQMEITGQVVKLHCTGRIINLKTTL